MKLSMDPLAHELSLDLTTQELQVLPQTTRLVEIDDICAVDPLLQGTKGAANAAADAIDDSAEIELTADQVEALLKAAGVS